DRLDALTREQVDEEVPEDEHDEQHAGEAHVEPRPLLPVRGATGARGGPRRGDRLGGHQAPPKTCMKWRGRNPASRPIQITTTPQNITRWARVPQLKKSIAMMRRPLRACRPIAATSAASPSPMIGVL